MWDVERAVAEVQWAHESGLNGVNFPAMRDGELPRNINGSRKRRIANGSGTRPQDVNMVLKQFSEAQKMMKAIDGGKNPIPGLAAPGMARRRKR